MFALYLVLGIWLVASAVNQKRWKFWLKVQAFDIFGLLPSWTFFAPNPGTNDVRVVFRDVRSDGTRGHWEELSTAGHRSPLIRAVWNPEKFDSKTVFDLAQLLGKEAEAVKKVPRAMLVSISYIQLLDPVMKCPRSKGASARQFALIGTRGHVPPRETGIIMLSQVHRFD